MPKDTAHFLFVSIRPHAEEQEEETLASVSPKPLKVHLVEKRCSIKDENINISKSFDALINELSE